MCGVAEGREKEAVRERSSGGREEGILSSLRMELRRGVDWDRAVEKADVLVLVAGVVAVLVVFLVGVLVGVFVGMDIVSESRFRLPGVPASPPPPFPRNALLRIPKAFLYFAGGHGGRPLRSGSLSRPARR